MKPITNDDLWACIRGCGMMKDSIMELTRQLVEHNASGPEWTDTFAGKVRAEALRQAIALKRSLNAK